MSHPSGSGKLSPQKKNVFSWTSSTQPARPNVLGSYADVHSSVAVVEGRLRGHSDADLPALEVDAVEPLEGGVGGVGLFVLDDAVPLGLARGVVLVDAHGEGPLVLVAPLLLSGKKKIQQREKRTRKRKEGRTHGDTACQWIEGSLVKIK